MSADLARLGDLLQQARSAIAAHQFRAADEALQQATILATTAEHRALVDRLQRLGQCADEFWNAVMTTARKLQATEEITFGAGELVVLVVENSARFDHDPPSGPEHTYPLADLPAGLALAIAALAVLNEEDPQTQVLFGAGLVTVKEVKPEHMEEARKYWERAAAAGAEVADLQATLDGLIQARSVTDMASSYEHVQDAVRKDKAMLQMCPLRRANRLVLCDRCDHVREASRRIPGRSAMTF